jgi:beta-lactamase class A
VNRKICKAEVPLHGVNLCKPICLVGLLMTILLAGCADKGAPKAKTPAPINTQQPQFLESLLSDIASPARGRVGVFASVIETNETIASLNPRDHFPMQSVYKLPICMAVLKQVDAGMIRLDQKVKIAREDYVPGAAHSPIRDKYPKGTELTVDDLIRFALSESDGTASDVLLKLAGGSATVQMFINDLQVTDIVVLNTEKELAQDWQAQYRNSATPEAAAALLRALYEQRELSESGRALLLKYMTESKPGAKRLKGLLPEGTVVAHKTGTSGTQNGITAATNDIGIVTLPSGKHLVIAVFVSDSTADDSIREGVIARAAKLIFDSVNAK